MDDIEILKYFYRHEDPALSTSEVADWLDFSPYGAGKRLKSLAGDGLLIEKDVGQTNIYWLTDAGRLFVEESDE